MKLKKVEGHREIHTFTREKLEKSAILTTSNTPCSCEHPKFRVIKDFAGISMEEESC